MIRILLVDDCSQNRRLVKKWLIKRDYAVLEADNGEEAVQMAINETPDLILMDMVIPRMNGVEATTEIKAHPAIGKTPVIALTGYCGFKEQKEAMMAGCCAVLSKPVDFKMLEDLIGEKVTARA